MKTLSLVINYTAETANEPSLGLEQKAVASNSLTTDDLYEMLSLARSGVSAKLYRPRTCDVSVVGGAILTTLTAYVWPKPLDLNYTLATNYGTVSERQAITQYREFDLVINMSKTVELPFTASSISYQKSQLPFFDATGNIVGEPIITFDDRYAYVSTEVVGVIRVSCTACGFSNTVDLSFTKDAQQTISNINITLSASFYTSSNTLSTTALSLDLPGCLELLLSTCENELLTEKTYGSVDSDDDDVTVPVVYYSDCSGKFLQVRDEKP